MNAVNSDRDQKENGKPNYKIKNIYIISYLSMFFFHTKLQRTKLNSWNTFVINPNISWLAAFSYNPVYIIKNIKTEDIK